MPMERRPGRRWCRASTRSCGPTRSRTIAGIIKRSAIISITRILNQGLMIISPVILVRLLSVEDFGRYREFILYSSLLAGIAGFGINTSLLRFIPSDPPMRWRFVNQALLMTLTMSGLLVGGMLALDAVLPGELVGPYAVPIALYVLLFVNFDFWEHFWLADRRTMAVFGYTSGRLIARILVVVTTAALTRNVTMIVWALVALELVRLVASVLAWHSLQARDWHRHAPAERGLWRAQLRYCAPFGASLILVNSNKALASLFVAKLMGPVALAHYAIGTYVQPIIVALRNSLSDVLLSEMSARERSGAADPLRLWRRSGVVMLAILLACAVVLAKYAHIIITTVFSDEYRSAVPVFQIYLLVLVRESLDFSVPMRAISRTAPILHGNMLGITVNALLLSTLLPIFGLLGAVSAYVVSRFAEGMYLGWQLRRAYGVGWNRIGNWGDLAKVLVAALLASAVLYGSFWTDALGLPGVLAGGAAYALVFACLLLLLRIPEFIALLDRLKRIQRRVRAGPA